MLFLEKMNIGKEHLGIEKNRYSLIIVVFDLERFIRDIITCIQSIFYINYIYKLPVSTVLLVVSGSFRPGILDGCEFLEGTFVAPQTAGRLV